MRALAARIERLERAKAEQTGAHCIPIVVQGENETTDEAVARAAAIGGRAVTFAIGERDPNEGVSITDDDGSEIPAAEWLSTRGRK